ncbi:MAG: FHA domain-containing protein [Candidatus Viridilinea halotolerans]|uniref:FHA domain-containing protein n=1 Tax=Candidatus Viridilinea halotolerans TaxID=2491704 RepID=A0A426TQH1_9CHLR|nr:MAG: FHA domain-containing protein [Candidatus Viridilinea halotolerans]
MFDIANLSIGVIMLLLRVAVIFLLYFFLWQVLRVVARDLRSAAAPQSHTPAPYGQLVVTSAGQTGIPVGKIFPLSPVSIIGRSTEVELALNDTFLSSEHARLELRDGVWWLEDLNSTNGTFLNGFEVRGSTELHAGDVVRIGRVELKLVMN